MTALTFIRRNLAIVALFLVMVAVAGNVYTSLNNQSDQLETCHQVEALKTVVRQVIRQSSDALGKPGTAGYAYYRAHPDELAAARKAADAELGEFSPHHC